MEKRLYKANLYSGASSSRGPATTSDAWTCPKHHPTLIQWPPNTTEKHKINSNKKKRKLRNWKHIRLSTNNGLEIQMFVRNCILPPSVEFPAQKLFQKASSAVEAFHKTWLNWICRTSTTTSKAAITTVKLETDSSLTVTREASGFRALDKRFGRLCPCGFCRGKRANIQTKNS